MYREVRRIVFGLGSNLGDRAALLRAGEQELCRLASVTGGQMSSIYETEPVGGPPQGRYLNAALLLVTDATAEALLEAAMLIESHQGRVRRERNGPRTLDIDLLWIEDELVDLPSLVVPHPRLLERAFALVPLLEVAPDACDPRTGTPLGAAVSALDPSGMVLFAAAGTPAGSIATPPVGGTGARLDTLRRKC